MKFIKIHDELINFDKVLRIKKQDGTLWPPSYRKNNGGEEAKFYIRVHFENSTTSIRFETIEERDLEYDNLLEALVRRQP